MSISFPTEAKRGCGYRKAGGLYIVAGGAAQECGKLPVPLDICPTCHAGIHQARGWTWIEPAPLFLARRCTFPDCGYCPLHRENVILSAALRVRAGLLWVGEKFYKTPGEFLREGMAQGISRRVSALPNDFIVGLTRVYFAHQKATPGYDDELGEFREGGADMGPGLFGSFVATAVQYVLKPDECAAYQHYEGMSDDCVADLAGGLPSAQIAIDMRQKEARGIELVFPTRIDDHGQTVDENGRPTGEVLQ